MRVLHLADPKFCGEEGLLACAAAMRIPGAEHEAWIVGDTDDERVAHRLGIAASDRVPIRRGALGGWRGLARLADRRFSASGLPDIVQCWSVSGLAAARRALGKRIPPRVGVLTRPLHPRTSVDSYALSEATLAAVSMAVRSSHAEAASARRGGRLLESNIRLIEPPVFEHGGPLHVDRENVRRAMSLSTSDVAIGLLSSPPSDADLERLMFAVGLAYTMGHRLVAIARRGVGHQRRAVRHVRSHGRRWDLRLTEATIVEIAAASDVAVIDAHPTGAPGAGTCGPIALSLCAAMAVPVIAAGSAAPSDSWTELPPVVRARNDDRGQLAPAFAMVLEDPRLRAEFAAAQRSWSDRARAASGFEQTLAAIWRETANVPQRRAGLPTPTLLQASMP